MSGRALAGTAAGTIELATTYSAITGTPPEGFPPPFVVADTVTDSSGNYLFEGVQPGTVFVRWDLSGITTDYRITEAHQGDDDTLDSDGVSGDVGGFVDSYDPLTLETSTDLTSWTPIATATPDAEVWSFVHDAELATGPSRFYRAFLTP